MTSSRITIVLVCLCTMALAACNGGSGSDDGGGSSSGQSASRVVPVVPSRPSGTDQNDSKNETPDDSRDDKQNESRDESGDESQDKSEDQAQDEPRDEAQDDSEDQPREDDADEDGEESENQAENETQDEADDQGTPDDSDPVASEEGDESDDDTVADENAPEPGAGVVSFRAIKNAINPGASAAQRSGPPESGADVPVTVGQVFARGDVPQGESVTATIDGQSIPTQIDPKATWDDGSLRHAIISVRMPASSVERQSEVVFNRTEAAENASTVTLGDLLASNFDAVARFSINGTTYRASARDLLSQAQQSGSCRPWGETCKRWLSGPVASEWIVGGPVQAEGQSEPNLNVYFNVRAYADNSGNVSNVRVDYVVENAWAYRAAPKNLTYDANLTTGGQSYEVSDLTHYTQARWHKVLWWQGNPNVYARLNGDYLQSTGAVSKYADVSPTDDFLNSVRTSVKPMTNGDQTAAMGATGAQAAIGPLPRWTSTYIVSNDPRAFSWMLANDDAVGSYSFHYRDNETGRPLEITRHPYVTIANKGWAHQSRNPKYKKDLLPRCPGDCDTPYTFNIAHHPSIGVVPYLVTGDYYYLEEMQFTASYVELWANEKYRDYDKGILSHAQGQVRGQAWGLRSIADAAFATPDSDPLKTYYKGLVSNILDNYDQELTQSSATENPLHVVNNRGAVVYPLNGQNRVGIAPWQQDFFTWSMGHAVELGNENAAAVSRWLAKFQVDRMTNWEKYDDGFCWLQASAYKLQIRDTLDGPDYASLDESYTQTYPELVGLKCDSQQMVNRWEDGRYQIGQMYGYASSPTGFPSNFQIGLAEAADSGAPGAKRAWQIFAGRSVKPDYGNYPNFAVIPRN